jgi:small-conductance mechanosensitive channel
MQQYVQQILFDPTVGKIVAVAIGIAIIMTAAKILKRTLTRYVKDSDTRYRARKFLTFLSYAAILLYLSVVFSDQLGGLTVAFGVAGAGIAFALQEVIASFAGWVAISFGSFYKTGDRVQLGGIKGDVIDIGVLRSTLMEVGQWVNGDLYNGRVVRIANSFVFKEPVFNYSGDFPFLWDEIIIPVKYGSDYRRARSLLERVANEVTGDYAREARTSWAGMVEKYMIEDARVEPMITLVANDNWMEFTVRYVVDYKKRRTTKDILFQRILEEVDRTKGKIALASATFEVVGVPPITVKGAQGKNIRAR